jgi:hypothetical protein
MEIKHKEIKSLFTDLFNKEEQNQIEYIYKKIKSDEPFESWRKYVDNLDDKIGGVGSKQLMVYQKDPKGYTADYHIDNRRIYRCMQYVLAYYFNARNDTTRLGINYCCMHIENILKRKYNKQQLPLGSIVSFIKKNILENENIIRLLNLIVPIWNETKHELDDDLLEFKIDEDNIIRTSSHKFSMSEVVVMYFICRKIGLWLMSD